MDLLNRSLVKVSPSGLGKKPASTALPLEIIQRRIYLARGRKVMLSNHLAELYDVEPRALVQAVKRNLDRFPADFMFHLTAEEFVGEGPGGRRRMLSLNKALPCCPVCLKASARSQ